MPSGHVIHVFAFDTGAEVDLKKVGDLIDEHPSFEEVDLRKTAPKYVNLPRPLTVRFPRVVLETLQGPLEAEVSARIFAVGAVSLAIRIPVRVATLADLVGWGTLRVVSDEGTRDLESVARRHFAALMEGLKASLVAPYPVEVPPEGYVVYALDDAGASPTELASTHRNEVAGVVAGERDWSRLAPEEVGDNLRHWFRYFEDDLVVVDWDYALVVEPSGKYEDVLYILELANLQLLELRTYDKYLDDVLERAYEDLDRFYRRGGLFRSARELQKDLSEVRLDLSRMTDAVENIGKIFGDYYLAKLYSGAADRFHLHEWQKSVNEKLGALNDLYSLATHEVEHRRAVLLETMIILLFVLDIVLIVFAEV